MNDSNNSSIKVLSAPGVVNSNPRIYWGVENPSCKDIDGLILSQLEAGLCANVDISDVMSWHVISSDTDWFSKTESRVEKLFEDTQGFAGGGGNGLRFEYFLKLISSHVCVYENNTLHVIKGNVEEKVYDKFSKSFRDKTVVAYKLD